MGKRKVIEYLKGGASVFGNWFHSLDAHSAAKVTTALYRLEQGNFSNVKSVGEGVSE
jgi:putative component of toxin-antitoxin plasmid stabilization module